MSAPSNAKRGIFAYRKKSVPTLSNLFSSSSTTIPLASPNSSNQKEEVPENTKTNNVEVEKEKCASKSMLIGEGLEQTSYSSSNTYPAVGSTAPIFQSESLPRNSKSDRKEGHTRVGEKSPGEKDKSSVSLLKLMDKKVTGAIQSLDSIPDKLANDELKASTIANFNDRFPKISAPLLNYHSCAWERDILWHGRMYLTVDALCFYSNIFGHEIKLVIEMSEIVSIEKANFAGVIPNAINVYTKDSKYFFASFIKRDLVFESFQSLRIKFNDALSIDETQSKRLSGNENTEVDDHSEKSLLEDFSKDLNQVRVEILIKKGLKSLLLLFLGGAILVTLSYGYSYSNRLVAEKDLIHWMQVFSKAKHEHSNLANQRLLNVAHIQPKLQDKIAQLMKYKNDSS